METMPIAYTIPDSSSLAMTGKYPPRTFRGLQDFNQAINTLQERLRQRDVNQFLSFKHVSAKSFRSLDKNLGQLGTGVRITYFPDIETLIVKVVTAPHETAHRAFTDEAISSLSIMGISLDERVPTGAARYTAPSNSRKEGDSTYKNNLLRPRNTDWPHWVIESGVSESLPRLLQDVNWWIGNSAGRVLLVLLFKVSRAEKKFTIEKYFPQARQRPSTRAQAGGTSFVPQRISTTVVNMRTTPPTIQGPSVVLEFSRVIGRQPVPPEKDLVFGPEKLIQIGRVVFWDMA